MGADKKSSKSSKPSTEINGNNSIGPIGGEKSCLTELRSLVAGDSKINVYNIEDAMLLKFLRARKNEPQVAFELLKNYIKMIQSKPGLFSWDDSVFKVIESKIYVPYQHKNVSGEKIVCLQIGNWSPSELKFETIIKASLFVEETYLMDEEVQKNGFVFLFDMRGLSLGQIYSMGVSGAMLLSQLTDVTMPVKVVNMHVCFENKLTDMAYSMFRPFLSEELKQRIIFQGHDMTDLFNKVPKLNCPSEWLGDGEPINSVQVAHEISKRKDDVEKNWNQFKKNKK